MQTIQAGEAQVGREYSSPKGVVVTIVQHLPDGQVRVQNKAGRETTIPGSHVLVVPEAPTVQVAELAGKPRDQLEPALAGLSEDELDELAKLDTRAWVQHAIAAEMDRRAKAPPPRPTPPTDGEILQRAVASVAPGVAAVLRADTASAEELAVARELREALAALSRQGVSVLPPHGSDTEAREVGWLRGQLDEVEAGRLHLSREGVEEFRARLAAAAPRKKIPYSGSRGALLDLAEGALKWLQAHDIEQFDLEGEPGQVVNLWLEGLDEEPTERVAAAWDAAGALRRARERIAAAREEGADQGAARQGRSTPRRVREADRRRFHDEGAAAWRAGQQRPDSAPEGWPRAALRALQEGWDGEQRAASERSRAAVAAVLEQHPELQPGAQQEDDPMPGEDEPALPDGADADGDADPMPGDHEDDPMPGADDEDPAPGADPAERAWTEAELSSGEFWLEDGPGKTVIATRVGDQPPELLRKALAPDPAPAAPGEALAPDDGPAAWLEQQGRRVGRVLAPEIVACFGGLVGSVRENTAALGQPLAWEAPLVRLAARYEQEHQARPTVLGKLQQRLQRLEAGGRPRRAQPPEPGAAEPAAAPAPQPAPSAPPPPAPVDDTHGLEGEALARARRIQANLRRMADAIPAVLALQEAAAALGADGARLDLGPLLGLAAAR